MNARIILTFTLVLLVAGCATTGPDNSAEKGRAVVKVRPNIDPKIMIAYESALVSMRAGDTLKAEKQFKKLASDYPQYSGPHNSLGILYFRGVRASLNKRRAIMKRLCRPIAIMLMLI